MQPADPINPQRVVLGALVAPARRLHRHGRQRHVTAGTRAICGSARHDGLGLRHAGDHGLRVPYAIAAKFAHPDRPVIALVGDGAMQMNGMAELITIAKYWKDWADPRLIVMVLNNRDLAHVTWEERVQAGDPKCEASQALPDLPYARFAELIGLKGILSTTPSRSDRLGRGAGRRSPGCSRMVTDPNVPPLPPHITLKQARQFVNSLVKGEPEAGERVDQQRPPACWLDHARQEGIGSGQRVGGCEVSVGTPALREHAAETVCIAPTARGTSDEDPEPAPGSGRSRRCGCAAEPPGTRRSSCGAGRLNLRMVKSAEATDRHAPWAS